MQKIKFKIVVPEKVVFDQQVDQITLPTELGQITILPNHLPLVAIVRAGEIMVKNNGQADFLAVSNGFLQVDKNQATVLAETAERSEEIDEERAEAARKKAQNLLKEIKNRDEVSYTALASKIEKEIARLKVRRRKKL